MIMVVYINRMYFEKNRVRREWLCIGRLGGNHMTIVMHFHFVHWFSGLLMNN
jgi:hypothetical protein